MTERPSLLKHDTIAILCYIFGVLVIIYYPIITWVEDSSEIREVIKRLFTLDFEFHKEFNGEKKQ